MRILIVFLLILFLMPVATPQRTRIPVPVGVREGEKAMEQPVEPPLLSPRFKHTTPAELKQQALALSQLAGMIPAQIEAINRGELPKDFSDNLKRIEKLARHLRAEVTH